MSSTNVSAGSLRAGDRITFPAPADEARGALLPRSSVREVIGDVRSDGNRVFFRTRDISSHQERDEELPAHSGCLVGRQ